MGDRETSLSGLLQRPVRVPLPAQGCVVAVLLGAPTLQAGPRVPGARVEAGCSRSLGGGHEERKASPKKCALWGRRGGRGSASRPGATDTSMTRTQGFTERHWPRTGGHVLACSLLFYFMKTQDKTKCPLVPTAQFIARLTSGWQPLLESVA